MSLVSIVLPVYNGENFLQDALESIVNQIYKNWELIIVNDCSTDSTIDICKKWVAIDNRIKLVNNEVNLKLPASLNKGFKLSKGDYLTWTSHDNILQPDFICECLKYLKSGYDFVYSNYEIIGDECRLVKTLPAERILDFNVIGASFMYSRRVYDIVGEYREDLFLLEDYDYWIRISESFHLFKIDKVIYKYRVHGKSLSSERMRDIEILTAKYMINKILEYKKINHNSKALINSCLWQSFRLFRVKSYIHALYPLLIGFSLSPINFSLNLIKFVSRGFKVA